MEKNIIKLKNEFKRIKAKGYIKGKFNGSGSIGRTFEEELGLNENGFSVPDYYGIEIKTKRAYSKSAITLFTAVPDGENLFEIERIKETYGYPFKKDKNYKALYIEAYGNKLSFAGIKYQYKIDVDIITKRVYLTIFNKFGDLIERNVYWSFDYLKERIYNKLNYLAVINTWTKKIDNSEYYNYYKMDIYKLKDFKRFLSLLEDGTIKFSLKVDIHLSENRYGKTYNHGCGFAINECDLPKLYDKL